MATRSFPSGHPPLVDDTDRRNDLDTSPELVGVVSTCETCRGAMENVLGIVAHVFAYDWIVEVSAQFDTKYPT